MSFLSRLLASVFVVVVVLATGTQGGKECAQRSVVDSHPIAYGPCEYTERIVEGDFNGDGRTDFAVACRSGLLLLLRNATTGDLDEQPPLLTTFNSRCQFMLAVDVNGDSDMDIVASCTAASRVYVFDNSDGSGTFATAVSEYFANPRQIEVRDIDGDGRDDIVVVGKNTAMRVLFQTTVASGPSTFGPLTSIVSGLDDRVHTFEFGLINDDAEIDVVIGGRSVYVAYGQGSGSFSSVQTLFTDTDNVFHGVGTFVIDLDGDGLLDILFTSSSFGEFRFHKCINATGPTALFLPDALLSTIPRPTLVERHDISGNGLLDDFVLAGSTSGTAVVYNFEPTSSGTVSLTVNELTNTLATYSAAVSDFDGDGDNDILLMSSLPQISILRSAAAPSVSVPEFGSPVTVPRSSDYIESVRVTDVNADGILDVVFLSRVGYAVSLILGTADGLSTNVIDMVFLSHVLSIGIADINLDGVLDVLPWGGDSGPQALLANEIGAVTVDVIAPMALDVGMFSNISADWVTRKGQLGDCNADGYTDVMFGLAPVNDLMIMRGTADTTWQTPSTIYSGPSSSFFSDVWVDVDGDGDLDIVAVSNSNELLVLTNMGSASCTFATSVVFSSFGASAGKLVAHDLDGDGDSDLTCVLGSADLGWIEASNVTGEGFTQWTYHPLVLAMLSPSFASAGHINGDNALDLAVPEFNAMRVVLLWGTGPGVWDTGSPTYIDSLVSEKPHIVQLADYTGDGLLDLIVGWRSGMTLHPQLSAGAFGFSSQVVTARPSDCGYTVGCIMSALADASGCAPSVSVSIPPGRYYGCYTHPDVGAYSLDGVSVTLTASAGPGSVIIDCGAHGGGGLVSATSRSGPTSLTVQGIQVLGSTRPFSASGNVVLSLTQTTLNETSGPVVVAVQGASVSLVDVDIWQVNSDADGGAFVVASGATLDAHNSTVSDASSAGNGGVVAVADSGSAVSFTGCTLLHSSAGGAGGVVYASVGATAVLKSTVVSGVSARFGGACAGYAAGSKFDFARESPSLLPVVAAAAAAAADDDDTVALSPACRLEGVTLSGAWSVTYGGVLALCGASGSSNDTTVDSGISMSVATAGGVLFHCRTTSGVGAGTSTAWSALEPALVVGLASASPLYGPVRASPGASLAWITPPPTSAVTGAALGGGVAELLDMYGQRVVDGAVTARASVDPQNGGSAAYTISGPGGVTQTADAASGLDISQLAVAAVGPDGINVESPTVTVFITGNLDDASPSLSFGLQLTSCPVGWGRISADGAPLVCAACGAQETSTTTSLDPCDPLIQCPPGVLAIDQACVPCPENSERAPLTSPLFHNGSIPGVPPCICNTGFWTNKPSPVDVACIPCPDGGLCRGGADKPVSRPGFFKVDESTFSQCERPGACRGGNACNDGYVGNSCSTCAPGYYSTSSLECARCPNGDKALFSAAVILFLIACVAWVGFLKFIDASLEQGLDAPRSRVPLAVSTMVVFAQILGVIGTSSHLRWPSSAEQTFALLHLSNWNLKLFAAECSVASFSIRFMLRTLYPALLLLICVPMICVLRLSFMPAAVRLGSHFHVLLQKTVVTLGPLVYISVSQASFSLFDCTKEPGGDFFLDSDPSVKCFKSDWFSALPMGILSLLLFTVGIPVFIMGHLLYFRDSLRDPVIMAVFGSAYSLFQTRFWYFEAVLLSKRLIVVVVTLFLSRWPFWQVGLLCIVFVSFTYLQMSVEPYHAPAHNTLDNRVSFVIVAVLVCGFVFYADTFPSSDVRTLLEVVLLATIIVGFVIIVAALVTEVRAMRGSAFIVGEGKESPVASDSRMRRVWRNLEAELAECWHIEDAHERANVINACKEIVSEAIITLGPVRRHRLSSSSNRASGSLDTLAMDEISMDVFAVE